MISFNLDLRDHSLADAERRQRIEAEKQRSLILAGQYAIQQAEEARAAQKDRADKVGTILEEQKTQHRQFGYTADVLNQVGKARAKVVGLDPSMVPKWTPTDEDGGYDVTIGEQTMRINPRREQDERNRAKAAQFAAASGVDPAAQGLLGPAPTNMPLWARQRESHLSTAPNTYAYRQGILPADDPEAMRVPYMDAPGGGRMNPEVAAYQRSLDVGVDTELAEKVLLSSILQRGKLAVQESRNEGAVKAVERRAALRPKGTPKGPKDLDLPANAQVLAIDKRLEDVSKLVEKIDEKSKRKVTIRVAKDPLQQDEVDRLERTRRVALSKMSSGARSAYGGGGEESGPKRRPFIQNGKKMWQYEDGRIEPQ